MLFFMKSFKYLSIALLAIVLVGQLWWPTPENHLREGDIVFRGTGIGVASLTLSKWTHCGILVKENDIWMVYEAIGPVKKTTLSEWKRHDVPYIFCVMRPKKELSAHQLKQIRQRLNSLSGRRYDNSYRWSDDRQYCSELVWKAYHAAGIDLSTPRKADTFLTFKILPKEVVDKVLRKKKINPNDPMVPPCDLVNSNFLKRVW